MRAKLSGGFYFNIWNGGPDPCKNASSCYTSNNGNNYISLSYTQRYCHFNVCGNWGGYDYLPIMDAYVMDGKVDDGMPQSGGVTAFYWGHDSHYGAWAGGEHGGTGLHEGNGWLHQAGKPTTNANPQGATNCYDNGGVAGTPQRYSTSLENGEAKNCALSFKF